MSLHDQEGTTDTANSVSDESLDVAFSLPQPSAPSPMNAPTMQQLHFGPSETGARPEIQQPASSNAASPS